MFINFSVECAGRTMKYLFWSHFLKRPAQQPCLCLFFNGKGLLKEKKKTYPNHPAHYFFRFFLLLVFVVTQVFFKRGINKQNAPPFFKAIVKRMAPSSFWLLLQSSTADVFFRMCINPFVLPRPSSFSSFVCVDVRRSFINRRRRRRAWGDLGPATGLVRVLYRDQPQRKWRMGGSL